MKADQKTFEDLQKTIVEFGERHTGYASDNLFVLWFVRAYLVETDALAAGAVCGRVRDKGVDAILTVPEAKTIFIVQGKYRETLGACTEKRADVVAFADIANRICEGDEEAYRQFSESIAEPVASKLRQAREDITKKKFKLVLFYVTLGVCSQSVINDARQTIKRAKGDARLEVIDGRRVLQIYRDYLDGIAPPVPTLDLEMESGASVKVNGILQRYDSKEKIESWVFTMQGSAVADLFRIGGLRLFARNIRGFLGHTPVNAGMVSTLRRESNRFFYYNNGVTIVCDHAEKRSHQGTDILQVSNPQVINGQQTTRTLAENPTYAATATVLVKVIQVPRNSGEPPANFEALISSIVQGTNWQNAIKASDLMANDRTQIGIERELRKYGYTYARKRQTKAETAQMDSSRSYHVITKEELAQAVAACELGGVTARTQKEKLFEEETYDRIFQKTRPSFYLPRYWLMVRAKSVAHGNLLRNESRWLVMAFSWKKIAHLLGKAHSALAFVEGSRRRKGELIRPLDRMLREVFVAAGMFYRSSAREGSKKVESAKFFKSMRASDDAFAAYWEKEVPLSRKKKIEACLDSIRRFIEFSGDS